MRGMKTLFRHLTQGRPRATMTVARPALLAFSPPQPRPAAAAGGGSAGGGAQEPGPAAPAAQVAAGSPAGESVDAQVVARRVYDLMRQELAVEVDRRGSRRW